MEISLADPGSYGNFFPVPYHVFNSAGFARLNEDKADPVFYFVFSDKKPRVGLIAGLKNGVLSSPFSAPFGGFSFLSEDCRINYLDDSLNLLTDWAAKQNIQQLNITLPPDFYHPSFIAKQMNVLFRAGFQVAKADLNYQFPTSFLDEDYDKKIWYNARKNLKRSLDASLIFVKCETGDEKQQAYNIIAANREQRGFPLRMSWPQVQGTTAIVPADFFIVRHGDDEGIASAIVFHVAPGIVQVIYWGDLPAFAHLKTMNFLSYKVFEYYKSIGKEWVDIGPSTENSAPNYGLCEFKEGIGCSISPKFAFVKRLL